MMKDQLNHLLTNVRQTQADHPTAVIRILLGLLFVMTGVMKFTFPELRTAFSGQLHTPDNDFRQNFSTFTSSQRNLPQIQPGQFGNAI